LGNLYSLQKNDSLHNISTTLLWRFVV
jgi:hypothetical protein